jgi:hypothetical protein
MHVTTPGDWIQKHGTVPKNNASMRDTLSALVKHLDCCHAWVGQGPVQTLVVNKDTGIADDQAVCGLLHVVFL